MKKHFLKIVAVLTLAATLFTFTACGKKEAEKKQNDASALAAARWNEEFSNFDDCKSYALTTIAYATVNHKDDENVKIDIAIRTVNCYDFNNNAASIGNMSIKVLTPGYSLTDAEHYKDLTVSLIPGDTDGKAFFDGEWYNFDNIFYITNVDGIDYQVEYKDSENKYVGTKIDFADYGDTYISLLSSYKTLSGFYEYIESLDEFKAKASIELDNLVTISFPEEGMIKFDMKDESGKLLLSTIYHDKNNVTVNVPRFEIENNEEPGNPTDETV